MYRPNRGEHRHDENTYTHITIDQPAGRDLDFAETCQRLSHLDRKYGGWKSYRCARMRLVVADRHIPYEWGHDVYPGQICIALETAGFGAGKRFDGFHVVRYWDPEEQKTAERVAHVQRILEGGYRLFWGSPHGELIVERGEVEFVASVIGMYCNDRSPVLWMYAN